MNWSLAVCDICIENINTCARATCGIKKLMPVPYKNIEENAKKKS